MKELIEDKKMKLLEKVYNELMNDIVSFVSILVCHWNDIFMFAFVQWACKSRRSYTVQELDVVRLETLDYIQAIM